MRQSEIETMHARVLRRVQTPAEAKLWGALRNRRFHGLKFRRRVPFSAWVAGFYCAEYRLAIDLDGQPHRDLNRWGQQGHRVLHLRSAEIDRDLNAVLSLLEQELNL